jgi:hypothetical protein
MKNNCEMGNTVFGRRIICRTERNYSKQIYQYDCH